MSRRKSGSTSSGQGGGLPLRVRLGFGVGDLGGNLFFTAMGFWTLNYLTDTVGIAAAAAGFAIMIGKIWDAVTDPMMGFLSDRTRTRWGRRRPYLLFGSVPLLLTMWAFFTAPRFSSPLVGVLWATLALCLLNTAYTVVNIPYGALTPELTRDFRERTTLNGYRFSFAVIGTILGAAAVLPVVDLAGGDRRLGFSLVGLLFGVVMAATILATFFSVREPDVTRLPKPTAKFFETFLAVFRNPAYVRLLLVYACHLTGITFVQTILVYYFKYIYRNEGMTTVAMMLLLLTAMACVPISVAVSARIGKKRTYQLALGIVAVGCMAIFFLGHILGMTFTLAVMAVAGVGVGFAYVPPFAMLPDVVEVDAIRSKNRKEGAFYGMWTFVSKLGVALAAALAGLFLSLAGFVPDVEQTSSALLAIRLVIGPVPAAVLLAAILAIRRYPLDEAAYNAVLAEESPTLPTGAR